MIKILAAQFSRSMLASAYLFSLFCAPAYAAPGAAPKIDFILIEKAKRQLTLFSKSKAVKTYRVVLGASPDGDKTQQGDNKTPEGRYKIDRKNPASQFVRSLGISYPSANDIASAKKRGVKPGGDIMIHGTPDYIEPLYTLGVFPDWTAGCIALPTAQMLEVYDMVPLGTPIEIKP
jgi:murein L,D-transpeptidase YafK